LRRLLDINLLIALCDPNHLDHQRVAVWFAEIGGKAWVSCPITENGFIRILSNPNYPGLSGRVSVAKKLLQRLRRQNGHEFWADDYSIVDGTIDLDRLAGHQQITDLYLLGLAVRRKGRFTSIDRRIPAELVQGGAEAYEVVEC
jgi:toxin-antitoxin system PIN domain toxin